MNLSDINGSTSFNGTDSGSSYRCGQRPFEEQCQCSFIQELSVAAFAVQVVTLMIGIVSWAVVKSWRKFQNFVYLNLVFAMLFVTTEGFSEREGSVILILTNWLIVASFVFNYDCERRKSAFKIANFFGWCLPNVEDLLMKFFGLHYGVILGALLFLLCILQVLLLIRSFYDLAMQSIRKRSCVGCQNIIITISNLVFSWSFYALLLISCSATSNRESLQCSCLMYNVINAVSLIANLLFLSMRSHRRLWREYFVQRKLKLPS